MPLKISHKMALKIIRNQQMSELSEGVRYFVSRQLLRSSSKFNARDCEFVLHNSKTGRYVIPGISERVKYTSTTIHGHWLIGELRENIFHIGTLMFVCSSEHKIMGHLQNPSLVYDLYRNKESQNSRPHDSHRSFRFTTTTRTMVQQYKNSGIVCVLFKISFFINIIVQSFSLQWDSERTLRIWQCIPL